MLRTIFWRACSEGWLWTWELPNTLCGLLGLLLVWICWGRRARMYPYRSAWVVEVPAGRGAWGLALGRFIFLRAGCADQMLAHEYGHVRQSRLLGPLYLPVIGLPSLLHAFWHRIRRGDPEQYLRFYTESWAEAWKPKGEARSTGRNHLPRPSKT
jgi:hypothetical protein|nr:MAG: hypothetical protein KatS3mg041_1154 [Bacteroidota bacterium]